MFVGPASKTEEQVSCRRDWYQTVDKVHVSIFAKNVDRERSKIDVSENSVSAILKKLLYTSRCQELTARCTAGLC